MGEIRRENPHFSQEEFSGELRNRLAMMSQETHVVPFEEVVLAMLRWYRESKLPRHLENARLIIEGEENALDKIYLTQWAEKQGTLKLLENFFRT